jgi:cysteinyl-tRNA synthetase
MSCDLLGQHFDIHGGGADLQFPHHENEIAQSEGVFRTFDENGQSKDPEFVNYWMHNGHVRVNDEKMSKSLNNFFTLRDVLKEYDPEVIRFFILRAHYRSPVNYSDATLDESRQGLERLYTALSLLDTVPDESASKGLENSLDPVFVDTFNAAMNDDFNTPEAIAVLFNLATETNKEKDRLITTEVSARYLQLAHTLKTLANELGLLERTTKAYLQGGVLSISAEEIEQLIASRAQAKKDKNFQLSDQIRKDLLAKGIVLEDKPGGLTIWRKE